jgi:hypothetical protein
MLKHVTILRDIDTQTDFETKINDKWTVINPMDITDINYDDLED